MKYLLVLAVLLVAFHVWRSNRRERMRTPPPPKARPQSLAKPEAMTRCAHCGMHLPANEAVAGQRGSYCSRQHLGQAEG